MDLSNIIVVALVALAAMYLLPRLGIGRRGGGNSPLNPSGRNPGNRPGSGGAGGGGGIFPDVGGPRDKPDTDGDFVDRIDDDRPSKST